MRALVCGGRDFSDKLKLYRVLDSWPVVITTVITGMARGADHLAWQWAKDRGIETAEYPAQWNIYGKSAGYRRNMQMAVDGKPDMVIAFPGGVGTQHMINIALEKGIPLAKVICERPLQSSSFLQSC